MATRKRTLYGPTKLDCLIANGETGTAYDPNTQDEAVVIAGYIVAYAPNPVMAEAKLTELRNNRNRALRNLADQAAVQTSSDEAWQTLIDGDVISQRAA